MPVLSHGLDSSVQGSCIYLLVLAPLTDSGTPLLSSCILAGVNKTCLPLNQQKLLRISVQGSSTW